MTTVKINLCFDMDGTIADLYANPDWLPLLRAFDPTPYATARPIPNMSALARKLNRLQREGFELTIISWLSKTSTPEYDEAVTDAKLDWLHKHLPSVHWDNINIVPYGTPKSTFCDPDAFNILFDDEQKNCDEWDNNEMNMAVSASALMDFLRGI